MDEFHWLAQWFLKINYLTTCKNGRDYIKIHFHKNTISFTTFQGQPLQEQPQGFSINCIEKYISELLQDGHTRELLGKGSSYFL